MRVGSLVPGDSTRRGATARVCHKRKARVLQSPHRNQEEPHSPRREGSRARQETRHSHEQRCKHIYKASKKNKPSELQNLATNRSSMTDSKDEQSRRTLTDTEKRPVATSGRGQGHKQKTLDSKQRMWQCFVITINGM